MNCTPTQVLSSYPFAAKSLFAAVTLSADFLGRRGDSAVPHRRRAGQPVGALLGLRLELGAGVGMAAVFTAAANTPLALSLMAVELLGANAFPHVVIVCVLAYLVGGHRGIYSSQRLLHGKCGQLLPDPVALRDLAQAPQQADERTHQRGGRGTE